MGRWYWSISGLGHLVEPVWTGDFVNGKEQIVFVAKFLFHKVMHPLVLSINFFSQEKEALVNLEALNSPPAHEGFWAQVKYLQLFQIFIFRNQGPGNDLVVQTDQLNPATVWDKFITWQI